MEAALLKLLFHVDLPVVLHRRQIGAHPGQLGQAHVALADVERLPVQVRRGDVACRRCGIAVYTNKAALELHSTRRAGHDQRRTEAGVVRFRQIAKKSNRPRPGVTAVRGQAVVGVGAVFVGQRYQELALPQT